MILEDVQRHTLKYTFVLWQMYLIQYNTFGVRGHTTTIRWREVVPIHHPQRP